MFNMLIAIMGNTYAEVQKTANVVDKKTMAQMILDVESLMVLISGRWNFWWGL